MFFARLTDDPNAIAVPRDCPSDGEQRIRLATGASICGIAHRFTIGAKVCIGEIHKRRFEHNCGLLLG
jgi:hypothetical protein